VIMQIERSENQRCILIEGPHRQAGKECESETAQHSRWGIKAMAAKPSMACLCLSSKP
jgi:hypothetical protein